MSLYSDIVAGIITWTNRPKMTGEMDLAIRQAVKAAHRSGRYWRDLATVPLTSLPTDTVQQIDLSSVAPNFSQLQSIGVTGSTVQYDAITIDDLFDDYGAYKTDVCYGMGTYLMVRATSPQTALTLTYYKYPTILPITGLDSWIANMHPDLIILEAASTVLSLIGEQEIKSRVDGLVIGLKADLVAESLEIQGR